MNEKRYRSQVQGSRQALHDAAAEPRAARLRALTKALQGNAASRFGREHGFSDLRDDADFARAVPIRDYDGLRPWVEAAAAGERRVLTEDEPVVFFKSSGSTGGSSKLIPATRRFVRESFLPVYYAAGGPFLDLVPLDRNDAVLNLKHHPMPAPARTPAGVPHVGVSQVDYVRDFGAPVEIEPGLDTPWSVLPGRLDPTDWLEALYRRVRIAAEHDVRAVIGFNPAHVAGACDLVARSADRLLRDLGDGTLAGRPHGAPRPDLARALEARAAAGGELLPAHLWPRMRLLYCWPTGVAALYMPRLRERWGVGVELGDPPVGASEGLVGAALDRHPRAVTAAVGHTYLEFVPVEDQVRADSPTLAPWELEPGREYQVVLTHLGGFYRYAVGDVFRVLDVVAGTPRLEYAGRATAAEVAGVPLREAQLLRAVQGALERTGTELRNLSCRPGPERYELAVEGWRDWWPGEAERLAAAVDDELRHTWPPYTAARAAGRLLPLRARPVRPGAFGELWHRRVAAGLRPPQAKDAVFQRCAEAWDGLLAQPEAAA